ncbi:hypothetical protein HIM_08794 [Hirsutella minnesotensis 3608]|uniref:Dimethylaniline monooxygenase n=1 Tax=Hirsutella minnesotensis 3608 TaxID=1043627 RepID=A0A0F7ZSR5_9HYPO|nr:hypothetical protein HIM_08794 [Hirsutella minnesotensis 3608]
MRVAVIGGGPSGIVTLKYLLAARESLGCEPVEARLFELQPQIGGVFVARVYEDAELVSSKQLTTFSDFRQGGPNDFLTAEEYAKYLNDYCTEFKLWPCIRLSTKVISVTCNDKGGHVVSYTRIGSPNPLQWECDAIAVCSGLHFEPNIPHIKGLEKVPLVLHSSQFKQRKQFGAGKTVMIVGSGETGADLAYLAATSPTRRVILCHRDGFHMAPKRNPGPILLPIIGRKPNLKEPGIPIDVSRANLFDTTYAHPVLRNSMILWDYYFYYIKILLWLSSGTTAGMDQWIGGISAERHHPSKIFFNKSDKICPYISLPYRPNYPGWRLWLYALRSALVQRPIIDTHGKHVDLAPWPENIESDGTVCFRNNGRPEYDRMRKQIVKPEVVILCTGYQQSFPFFQPGRDQGKRTYPIPSDANVRGIWRRDEPAIGFIGFLRPSFGAIPPLAELQAQLWIVNLLAPTRLPRALSPRDEPHYRLHSPPSSRITYGVDQESYAYQLALDMNSAPGLCDILRLVRPNRSSWRLVVIWALGAHFNTKFRLQGPWRWSGAKDMLVSQEFWETITRRPLLFGHFATSLLPIMIFGPLSGLIFFWATVMEIVERIARYLK